MAAESANAARDHVLEDLDRRIAELDISRVKLLHDIAKQTPGYSVAYNWAVDNLAFDPAVGCVMDLVL